jgi:hypothetical protein
MESPGSSYVRRNNVLTIMSLLSIILLSLHLTDDIVYGTDRSAVLNVVAIAILVIWLYGALVLAEQRSGHVIMLLGSVAGLVVFTVHVNRAGGLPAGTLAESSGVFFFVWTILSAHGLWNLRRSRAPNASPKN